MRSENLFETRRGTVESATNRDRLIGGLVLVGLGLLLGLAQLFDVGMLILPLMGLFFVALGMLLRSAALMVPGGILGGIGLGSYLVTTIGSRGSAEAEGGIFLLAFAAGWASITILSALFTDEVAWWPLIPGAILGLIGAALLAGGTALTLLGVMGSLWPVGLVAAGLYLLLRWRRESV